MTQKQLNSCQPHPIPSSVTADHCRHRGAWISTPHSWLPTLRPVVPCRGILSLFSLLWKITLSDSKRSWFIAISKNLSRTQISLKDLKESSSGKPWWNPTYIHHPPLQIWQDLYKFWPVIQAAPPRKHGTGAGIPSQRPTSSVPQYSLEILSAWLHFASLRSELVLLRHELQPWTDTGLISTPLQPFRPYVCHAKRPTMCLEHLMMLIQLNRKHNHRALYSVCISTIFSLEDWIRGSRVGKRSLETARHQLLSSEGSKFDTMS